METRVADQPGFILHRRDWRDSSLILDLLSLDYGRVSLIAKGGRKGKSQSLLQPFCQLQVSWSGRTELKTLTALDGIEVPVSTRHYLSMLYVNELIIAFLPVRESFPELFYLYRELLLKADENFSDSDLRDFELNLMRLMGYLPDTSIDSESGDGIDANRFYQFVASTGFLSCEESEENSISGDLIIDWNARRYESKHVMQLAKTIMRCIIDFNLDGKQLKSRDIYLQIKSRT